MIKFKNILKESQYAPFDFSNGYISSAMYYIRRNQKSNFAEYIEKHQDEIKAFQKFLREIYNTDVLTCFRGLWYDPKQCIHSEQKDMVNKLLNMPEKTSFSFSVPRQHKLQAWTQTLSIAESFSGWSESDVKRYEKAGHPPQAYGEHSMILMSGVPINMIVLDMSQLKYTMDNRDLNIMLTPEAKKEDEITTYHNKQMHDVVMYKNSYSRIKKSYDDSRKATQKQKGYSDMTPDEQDAYDKKHKMGKYNPHNM